MVSVPLLAWKAVELLATPFVVEMFEPPPSTTVSATITSTLRVAVTPSESVAMIDPL